jgi:hypothetical protein
MAGWGGLAGLVTGGPKGMVKGALIGGLLGGVGGAAGIMGGGAMGATGAAGAGAQSLLADPIAGSIGAAGGVAWPGRSGWRGGCSGCRGKRLLGHAASGGGGNPQRPARRRRPRFAAVGAWRRSHQRGTGEGRSRSCSSRSRSRSKRITRLGGSFLPQSLLSPYAQPGYMQSPQLDAYAGTGSVGLRSGAGQARAQANDGSEANMGLINMQGPADAGTAVRGPQRASRTSAAEIPQSSSRATSNRTSRPKSSSNTIPSWGRRRTSSTAPAR